MIGLGLDLSLRNYATGISYVKANRVLDLTTPFSELTFTLEDKSGEGNDATLYSGRYISTDGSTDRGIVADCSAAGAGNYYLTGKVRPNAVTTAELTMDGSTDSGLTGLTADVWQTFTTATSAVTPSAVQVGYDGSTASAADWSDVKLIDASDGSTVARWQLNESADGDLNGYPALDSVGGYHGTHTGCAGGTAEGINADVVGAAFAANEDKMYFDGVDDYVEVTGMTASINYFGACTISANIYVSDPSETQAVWALGGGCYRLYMTGGNWFVNASTPTGIAVSAGEQTVSVTYNASGNATSFIINGTTVWSGSGVGSGTGTSFFIGARDSAGAGLFFTGLIYDFSITGSSVKNFAYAGNELVTWTDTTGGGNNGTVNGSPVTVGQKRATILQTAGMDWNRAAALSQAINATPAAIGWDTFSVSPLGFTGTISTDVGIAGWNLPTTVPIGERVTVRFSASFDQSPLIQLRDGVMPIPSSPASSNTIVSSGYNEITLTATAIAAAITFSEGDIPASLTISNFSVEYLDAAENNYLIPASDSTPSNDALGNAIAIPRPTADTWNLFGDAEYGLVADADSLDVTTEATWELWGNFYGVQPSNMGIFSKWDFGSDQRSWRIGKQSTTLADGLHLFLSTNGIAGVGTNIPAILADTTQHLVITYDAGTLLTYIDGALVATDTSTVTSIFSSTAVIQIGANGVDPPTEFYDDKISRPKIYNRALTADEVLQNFKAQKSSFGL